MKQQIRGLEELIRKLTRSLEKSVAPSFLSYETSNRISMSGNKWGFAAPAIKWYADELISKANTTAVVLAWQIGAPGHGQTVRAFSWTVCPLH